MEVPPNTGDMDLGAVATGERLLELLQLLHIRAGRPAYRTMQTRARDLGLALSKTRVGEILNGTRPPSRHDLIAFVRACDVPAAGVEPWVRAWERLAGSVPPGSRSAEWPPGPTDPDERGEPRHPHTATPWKHSFSGAICSSPTVVDQVVYVGGADGYLYTLEAATGRQRWKMQTRAAICCRPAVAGGLAYVGSTDGHVYAVDIATGQDRWKLPIHLARQLGNHIDSTPTVAQGMLYIGTSDRPSGGHLYAVDASTGEGP
ncbi:PQQ-binding-like beta-propeller repeat protein [Actinomadura sp. 21ATH]|uniref:outer membrane protein assembly factor BamB family protein n=1 Tax=Actinomadura sp. 21ATH TaxID=1735444 RepID=UPI0035C20D42